jgi:hypothetical protein
MTQFAFLVHHQIQFWVTKTQPTDDDDDDDAAVAALT